jgi:hypothetical protein
MAKYTILVDYGKPYEIKVNNEYKLKKELIKLKKFYESNKNNLAFFDIIIYNEEGKDITDEIPKSWWG